MLEKLEYYNCSLCTVHLNVFQMIFSFWNRKIRENCFHSAAISSLIIILFTCFSPSKLVSPLRIYGDLIEFDRSLRPFVLRYLRGARVWWLFWCLLLAFEEVRRLKPDIFPSADLLIYAKVAVFEELPEPILGCKFYMKTLRTRIWLLFVSLVTHLWPADVAVFKAVCFLDLLRYLIVLV